MYDASVNVLGSLNLLEAVRTHSPKTRFIFASTGGALYGDNTDAAELRGLQEGSGIAVRRSRS